MRFWTFLMCAIFGAACRPSMNYAIEDRNTRVRDFIGDRLVSNDSPGIQYVMLNSDSIVFAYCGGWADIAAETPMRFETTMMLYSMSKTFTAAATLQMIEQGKIALDDPVTKYVEGIPYGNTVTIHHLLSHSSGIPNPIPLKWVHPVEEHDDFVERESLQNVLDANPELDFEPGKRFAYSNISYWLLGRVVESRCDTSYEAYVRQNIFRRLGIPPGQMDFVIPSRQDHAKGYLPSTSFLNLFKSFVIDAKFIGEYEGDWLHIRDHYLNGPSFGGIVGSVRAVAIFLQDQLAEHSRLFNTDTKTLFFQQQKNNDGEPIPMTLGWHIGTMGQVDFFFKEGGGGGLHSEMRIYPGFHLASVVIANNTSFNTRQFLNTVDSEFLVNH